MQMRYLKPGDHESDPSGVEAVHLRFPDSPSGIHEMVLQFGLCVNPMVDFLARDDEHMSGCDWCDGEKRHANIVFPDESPWNLILDNAGEQGCHSRETSSLLVSGIRT